MEPLRSRPPRVPKKTGVRQGRSRAENAMHNAAGSMVTMSRSVCRHYRKPYDKNKPMPPLPQGSVYSHTRTSSADSSMSSQRLLDPEMASLPGVVEPPQNSRTSVHVAFLMKAPLIQEPHSETQAGSLDTSSPGEAGLRRSLLEPDSLSLLRPASIMYDDDDDDTATTITTPAGEIIQLSSPRLPPSLKMPRTPSLPPSLPETVYDPVVPAEEQDLSTVPTDQIDQDDHVTQVIQVDQVGQEHYAPKKAVQTTVTRFEPFKSNEAPYILLRPDCGTESEQLGTFTHVRGGSDWNKLEVRRKPLGPNARPLEFYHAPNNEVFLIAIICLAKLLAVAGFAQTLIPAQMISESFPSSQRTLGHMTWYSTAYALAAGSFSLIGNRLGVVLGPKRVLVFGFLWLGIWSLLAGLSVQVQVGGSAGLPYFCVCRCLQGIGPALLIPNGQIILRRAYSPGPRRKLVLGLFDAAGPVGFVVGSLMACLLSKYAFWAWAFYSTSFICLASTIAGMLLLPAKNVAIHHLEGGWLTRLDPLGALIGVTGLMLFGVGWNVTAIIQFAKPTGYALFALGAVLMIPFFIIEARAGHPLIPVKKMTASVAAVLVCNLANWGAVGIWVWYLVRFMEKLRAWDCLLVSAGFAPLLVTGAFTGLVGRRLLGQRYTGHWLLVLTSITILVGGVLMATAPEKQSYWLNAFFSILIMPVGVVLSVPSTTLVLRQGVDDGQPGLNSGLVATTVWYGITIGLGVAGTIQAYVQQASGSTLLESYQAAQYLGVGLSSLGVVIALLLRVVPRTQP